MDYWESIVQEVLHKTEQDYTFKFTDLGRAIFSDRSRRVRYEPETKTQVSLPTYLLGDDYKDTYFTKRETETLYYLLQGRTIPETARILRLSSRTIEFYVKNMKLKIGAKTKQELVDKVRLTKLMDHFKDDYDFDEFGYEG